MFPPRCFTCNAFIGHQWKIFAEKKNQQTFYGDTLNDMGITRICCRRMLLTHVEIIEDIAMYSSVTSIMDESKTVFDTHCKNTRTVSCD